MVASVRWRGAVRDVLHHFLLCRLPTAAKSADDFNCGHPRDVRARISSALAASLADAVPVDQTGSGVAGDDVHVDGLAAVLHRRGDGIRRDGHPLESHGIKISIIIAVLKIIDRYSTVIRR